VSKPQSRYPRVPLLLVTLVSAVVLSTVLPVGSVPTSAHRMADDLLPDLRMAKLEDLKIQVTSGRHLLRFTTIIVNVGDGPLEVHGYRPNTSTALMSTVQRIYDSTGGYRDVPTPAVMYFAGDGHYHWHVGYLETYQLKLLDNPDVIGTGAKHGFCFFDNVDYNLDLPGAPQSVQYRREGCGNAGSLQVEEGLSVSWGDAYRSNLPDQYIDITGLPDGSYRLRAIADATHWFEEINQNNNSTWVDLKFSGSGTKVEVLRYGPSA
jgi:hypothetical protein